MRNWQLLLILVPLAFVTATLLRLDHIKMVELRDAVIAADESGDTDALDKSLVALQEFVVSHVVVNVVETNGVQSITLGTGPFYLEHEYLRAAEAAITAAEQEFANDSNPYGNIYGAVLGICQPLAIANGWAWNNPNYLNCWTEELAKYPAGGELSNQLTVQIPSTALYRREFASPIWAPSWAGWAILACVLILFVIFVRLLIWCVLKIALIFAR